MEQTELKVEEGVSLVRIMRLLISHLKILIVTFLIGGILGASFAVWKTYNVNYYGSSLEFYVNPEKGDGSTDGDSQYGVYGAYGRHVMDNMVKLLSSESFIEQMLLDGEKLPSKEDGWYTEAENNAYEIEKKVDAANGKVNVFVAAENAMNAEILQQADITQDYKEKNELLNQIWQENYMASSESEDLFRTAAFSESTYLQIKPKLTAEKYQPLHNAYDARKASKEEVDAIKKSIELKQENRSAAQKEMNESVETALSAWRKTSKYKQTLSLYKQSVSFSYLQSGEDAEDADNLARSFIYVRISVLNNKKLAEELLEKVKVCVPQYVVNKMTVPNGYTSTNCIRTTRTDDIQLTNPGYTYNQAIKYGVLAAGCTLLAVAFVIVLIDRSDKRLRDTEVITKQFNVPLLGVVPCIDELMDEPSAKNESKKALKEVK